MNTYKYIVLGLIGISTCGLQGMHGMQQRAQTSYFSQISQITQKLHPYGYHIGGALALAGIVYGGYQAWKSIFNPYKIKYYYFDTSDKSTPSDYTSALTKPEYEICIASLRYNDEILKGVKKRSLSWQTGRPGHAINNFLDKCLKNAKLSGKNVLIRYKDHNTYCGFKSHNKDEIKQYLASLFMTTNSFSTKCIGYPGIGV
jgi:hypothetical protein